MAAAGPSSANSIRPPITHENGATSSSRGAQRAAPKDTTSSHAAKHAAGHQRCFETHRPVATPAADSATTPNAWAQGTNPSMGKRYDTNGTCNELARAVYKAGRRCETAPDY